MTLLECALVAEAAVAGTHLDNILPSLFGGIVLVRDEAKRDFIQLPVPAALRVVLAQPRQQLRTREARPVLPEMVTRADALLSGRPGRRDDYCLRHRRSQPCSEAR